MKEKVCYLVHTEYHLLLSVSDAMYRYNDTEKYDITIIIKRKGKSKRLKQDLDFSLLPYSVRYLDLDINLDTKLTPSEKEEVDKLLNLQFSTFIFFQEQDPVTIVLINAYKAAGADIYLFQDGMKAYSFHTMRFSLGLITDNIKQNKWIKRNGYTLQDPLSFLRCRKYAHLKHIDKVYLTFPEAYNNWNRKGLGEINTNFSPEVVAALKKIFKWDDSLLTEKENVIFYMNQPLGDDGSFEINVLKKLSARYPERKLYIKLHPLTSDAVVERYKQLPNAAVINSKIPAELFISELKESVILSVYSGSMFINNATSKFYWIYGITEGNNIARLKKITVINPTKHIVPVTQIENITF